MGDYETVWKDGCQRSGPWITMDGRGACLSCPAPVSRRCSWSLVVPALEIAAVTKERV